jgi:hypothetical protein
MKRRMHGIADAALSACGLAITTLLSIHFRWGKPQRNSSRQVSAMNAIPIVILALAACVASSSGSVLSVAGNDNLIGNRPANLIVNGSFEADGGVATNGSYWATGTTLSPIMSLTGWNASGQAASYAIWGSDGFGGVKGSASLPHGTNGLYFGAGIMAMVAPFPTEANDGQVSFSSTPAILPKPTDGPVTLQQTVTGLNPSSTYLLDFWTSGENVGQPEFPVDGFFGLDITGESRLYFAAPSGNGPVGTSQRYQVYFTPTASTVTFKWINWGHYSGPGGLSDELVLDDVILNLVSDPVPAVDCACLANLPGLQTNGCPAYVPDLCALATNCFTTNMLPGSCVQNPPAGSLAGPGTNSITLMVMDKQTNSVFCTVNFIVIPPPNPVLSLICVSNKTVECGSGWMFDEPIANTTCCDPFMTVNVVSNVTNGVCPKLITRTWQVTNTCGLSASCSQTVTVVDTTPPTTLCSGVNLVPNGNFEYHTACPSSGGQIGLAAPWFGPTDGTSDYFNPCASITFVSVPSNGCGVQVPLSGQGYAGIFVYSTNVSGPTSSYREYMEVPLLSSLVAGQTYRVSFYVSRAENYAQAIAEIGAHFSSGTVISNGFDSVLNLVPQVVNPSTNLLLSTTAWMLVQGTFVAAGGESYMTLGNFLTNAATTVVPASGLYTNFAYYYFDDVSVEPICAAAVTNKIVQCGSPWTFDPPTAFDACSGTNVTVSVASTVTNGLCPFAITRTWLLTDLCGNASTRSQTATVVGTSPPVVNCACLQDSALGLLSTNACAGLVPNLCQFTNCFFGSCGSVTATQSPPAGTLVGPGIHPITITVRDCSGVTSNGCVLPFQVNSSTSSLSLICSPTKSVQCGSAWDFDPPTAVTTCCNQKVSVNPATRVTNGTCPQSITGTFHAIDSCGNTASCSQTVTIVDTAAPVTMCSGVNLVPNGDFESYGVCPVSTSAMANAAPWFAPTLGSPDYFNGCVPSYLPTSVPTNFSGVQAAHSGQAYAGEIVYYPDANILAGSYREYIETPLLAPLVAGQAYRVSFYVNLADNAAYAVADLGAYLSVGPVLNYTMQEGLPVVPQVVNPSTNPLTSTNSWMLVQGVYTAAGGEDHLTIGSFTSDAATTAVPMGGTENWTYYYFDDMSVVALCPPTVTNKTVQCDSPWTFDQPVGLDRCSGSNVTVTVASTVTNGGCPRVITRTWALADACGNTSTWSQSVTLAGSKPVAVNCACLQDSVLGLLSTNGCVGIVPNLSVLTNSPCIFGTCGALSITQSPLAGTLVGPGTHLITVTITDCAGNSNGCVLPFQVNASAIAITCPPNLVLLTCATSAVAWFNVAATGNTGPVVCAPPPGSAFPLGNTVVTCTATNNCGGVATCSFTVRVRQVSWRWGCLQFALGVETIPMGTARTVFLPDFPGGGMGVNFDNLGSSGQDGVRLVPGPAQTLTFSTELDFTASEGATFELSAPPGADGTPGAPLLSLSRTCRPRCGWDIKENKRCVVDDSASFRTIAIGSNGNLFSSFTQDGAALDTNVLATLSPAPGVTSVVMTVTLDCRTREVSLDFPFCEWTPDAARKGWDGVIYGNGPRGSKTNQTARLVFTPLTTVASPPITTIDLLASNLTHVAFDNPSISSASKPRKRWGDGHVTLMKAYDDGARGGVEFVSFGEGGGVSTDLGHAASFQFRLGHFENGDIPDQQDIFSIRGWPPGTTTNRPPPPVFDVRLAPSTSGAGIDCAVDFTQWGVSNVTLQLWNGTALVSEKPHMPAMLASPLVTLSAFPEILGCPSVGVLSLANTNPFTVSGLDCSRGVCEGTELRILAELTPDSTPPVAFAGLECLISEGMDNLIYGLETTPACIPVPLNTVATPDVITLRWEGDGFRLQGAETVGGPWYDLGVNSPAPLPPSSGLRVFRLISD